MKKKLDFDNENFVKKVKEMTTEDIKIMLEEFKEIRDKDDSELNSWQR